MNKILYTSNDAGTSWSKVNEINQEVDGYVTGVSFRDGKVGWITATQHGESLLPFYRTQDGGKTWEPQKIEIIKGYKYGNTYPPVFDSKNNNNGTIEIEFVSETDTKKISYTTNDGGNTWSN
ncbi:hypothetical protein PMSD_06390 [Paenibacillus macquariensis subsp. defensor]|nr:hypothetical protein PMSD_06390 [Paenibacillus macquariensis subsp. defensor]